MKAIGALFHGLFSLIAQAIVALHRVTSVFGKDSGASWALAIVLLTILVRGLMYPLFVKQIKTQRAMTALQPKIKELQAKYKTDKETLNQELMKLYKEHNANPFAGCLPLLLQMPIFISLFQVLKQLEPHLVDPKNVALGYKWPTKFGLSEGTAKSLGSAKIFGAPIGAGFKSSAKLLEFLHATPGPVKIVSVLLIVAMTLTTFITSKQLMGANSSSSDDAQASQQKILLYAMPLFLAWFGFNVAIGVLVYWTTTNLFSMVQQAIVIRHLGPAGGTAPAKEPKPKPGPAPVPEVAPAEGPPPTARPANRNAKKGKGRRGGRR